MLYIIEKEIEIDETLKMRIELICKLAHVKPIFHTEVWKRLIILILVSLKLLLSLISQHTPKNQFQLLFYHKYAYLVST